MQKTLDRRGEEIERFDLIMLTYSGSKSFSVGLFWGRGENGTIQFIPISNSKLFKAKVLGEKSTWNYGGKNYPIHYSINWVNEGSCVLKITEDFLNKTELEYLNNYKKYIPNGNTRYRNIKGQD